MVAGARLNRAQLRITEMRPYALKTQEILSNIVTTSLDKAQEETEFFLHDHNPAHPLLVVRPEKNVLMLVLTSDRGLCGGFNTNITKRAEKEWRSRTTNDGQTIQLVIVGRKGRDYFRRRKAPVLENIPNVWENLNLETAKRIGERILEPFKKGDVDTIYIVYNEFKSAMTQHVVVEKLLPIPPRTKPVNEGISTEYICEPSKEELLEQIVPMYVDISILRALYESVASELGARMTAMDAATKNAKDIIGSLTLSYNQARQAAITKELMEIIGGSEALKE